MKRAFFIAAILFSTTVYAQNIPTGTWRTHYSFNTTVDISQSEAEIYAASSTGIFIIDKGDNSITSLTKLNGLNDTGITQINFNPTSNTLVIAYDNGQVDLLQDNSIKSIPDIKLSDILASKIIHHIYPYGNYSYLSTDFGVVQLDNKNQNIKDSYLKLSSAGTNLIVYASVVYNDSLFLATESGVIAGSLSDNLKDFSKWKRFDVLSGISQEPIKVISLYQGKPITGSNSSRILTYANGQWSSIGKLLGEDFHKMAELNSSTIISTGNGVYLLDNSGLSSIASPYITVSSAAIGDDAAIWVADIRNGVIKIEGANSESIYPNGPSFNTTDKLVALNGKVFALPQSFSSNGTPARNNQGFSLFEDGQWKNYNNSGFPNTVAIPEFLDITGVSSYQTNGVVFSSYGYGLLVWENNAFSVIDESVSPLINSSPPDRNVLIADISTNRQGTWVLNNNASTPLHLLSKEGTWTSFNTLSTVSGAKQIESTPWGHQWIAINGQSGGGIYIFSPDGGELTLKYAGFGTIPSNSINDLILDKEDKMWVATDKGVVYYQYPSNILNDPYQEAIKPIIDFHLLFNQEKVNALAVDGGNRIWMGTDQGAWLFDKDGSELVEHFNIDNSPLLSNIVTNIAINDLTGEVFFNTNKGLISYRGSGTLTGTYAQPKIFPNPVTPGYSGVITIEGVPLNSLLTITDASGRLVSKLKANGNTAVWDLQNGFSSDVGTGVYFVFISSDDGVQHQMGKIAIVK